MNFVTKATWTRTWLKVLSVFIRPYPCSSVFQKFVPTASHYS
jgi:hypothetical protein